MASPSRLLQRVLRPSAIRSVQARILASAQQQQAALPLGAQQTAQAPLLAPRRHYAHAPLGGKSVFSLRAAAEVAETAKKAAAPNSSGSGGNGSGGDGSGAAANANPYEGVVLPTSDESEQLLRIRHSVS